MKYRIREEEQRDFQNVNFVIKSAFYREDKNKNFNEWNLVKNLRNTKDYIKELSLVAEYQGEIIGHILFTPVQIQSKNEIYESLGLAPLSVTKSYQGNGIGSNLIKRGIKIAKKRGYTSVIVIGEPKYYSRFGFVKSSSWGIGLEGNFDSDYILAKELKSESLLKKNGVIKYADSFYDKNGDLI